MSNVRQHEVKSVVRGASEDAVLAQVRACVEMLEAGAIEQLVAEVGYALAFGRNPAKCIREAIANYRSPELFPDEEHFQVSSWRTARGGNPSPRRNVVWYQSNASGLAGAVEFDLPLNGKWSDLQADFVLTESGAASGTCALSLEELSVTSRRPEDGVA